MANFFKRLFGKNDSKETTDTIVSSPVEKENTNEQKQQPTSDQLDDAKNAKEREQQLASDKVDYVKELETVVYDYCEKSSFRSKPNFNITKNTNFKRDLDFDGLDVVEVCFAFEKKFPVEIPPDHPYNNRLADDTDYTVEYLLSAYGLCDWKDKTPNSTQATKTTNDSEIINMDEKSDSAINKDPEIGDEEDKVFTVGNVQFKMKHVSAGTFIMGEGEENNTPHKVTLGEDYWIGETPVTQALWQAVMGNNPSHPGLRLDNAPVGNVNWNECQTFIDKLSELSGQRFHFPTEAQWEFAARGGNSSKGYIYSGSDDIDDVAWYWNNCDKKAHAVKTKKPNELGIYDMSGSVWEWCFDWAAEYDAEDDYNPIGPDITDTLKFLQRNIQNHIIRGGGLENEASACVTTARGQLHPSKRHPMVGLRLSIQ